MQKQRDELLIDAGATKGMEYSVPVEQFLADDGQFYVFMGDAALFLKAILALDERKAVDYSDDAEVVSDLNRLARAFSGAKKADFFCLTDDKAFDYSDIQEWSNN